MVGHVRRVWYPASALLALIAVVSLAHASRSDRDLPEEFQKSPYSLMSLSIGTPARGWQLRSKKLRETSSLVIKSSTDDGAVFGHPALVLMLQRTASQMVRNVQSTPLVVGDLSREYGGPLYGHHSHQSGRDADIGFFALDADGSAKQLDRFVKYDANGRAKDRSGLRFDDYRNWLMVLTWLKDERAEVKYVFVASHLRRRLLDFARSRREFAKYADEASRLLMQPRNSSAHDDHFHVRIKCPKRHEGLCKDY